MKEVNRNEKSLNLKKYFLASFLLLYCFTCLINPQIAYATQLQKTFVLESTQPIQRQTVDIPDLARIDSVSVDNGTVSYSKNGTSVDLNVENGSITNSKFVNAQSSENYNDGTYTGTLSSYLYSGSYTPSDTKSVSMTGFKLLFGKFRSFHLQL